jgi:enamine deaminase RidA (YjgF/YER057c/UK114 family)
MGFCLFNNVAIAATAALARGVERLAIVDWDVHHGTGTQDVFIDDPRVLYVSTHAAPFYPGTGEVDDLGAGAARGTNVNLPLPHGTGDAGFLAAWERVGVPMLERHRPQLVLVSSGWDAHARDPLGTLNVTTAGYTRAAAAVIDAARRLCDGRLIATLEGGYDTHALAWCASGLVELLLGDTPAPDPEPGRADRARRREPRPVAGASPSRAARALSCRPHRRSRTQEAAMTIERINPAGLSHPPTYSHVVRATGGSTVYISGQVPVDAAGHLVGGDDFEAQARQVYANLRTALAAVGADFSHVARMTTYVVDYRPELRDVIGRLRLEVMGDQLAASTLIGVQALAVPDYRIEIEAIAVLD